MKKLEVKWQGFVWHIDADAVADARASYYADKDPDTTYQEEYDFTYGDNEELLDWYNNNMNYEDVPEDKKRLVKAPDAPKEPPYNDTETSVINA